MPQLLIHRGLAKRKFLENNINSFKYCFNKNYGIETDIHATKDGEFICFHDFTLKRIFKNGLYIKSASMAFFTNAVWTISEFLQTLLNWINA